MYLRRVIHLKLVLKTAVSMRIRNTSTTSSIHYMSSTSIIYFNKSEPLIQHRDEIAAILLCCKILVAFGDSNAVVDTYLSVSLITERVPIG